MFNITKLGDQKLFRYERKLISWVMDGAITWGEAKRLKETYVKERMYGHK